jgi:hypothetical protein
MFITYLSECLYGLFKQFLTYIFLIVVGRVFKCVLKLKQKKKTYPIIDRFSVVDYILAHCARCSWFDPRVVQTFVYMNMPVHFGFEYFLCKLCMHFPIHTYLPLTLYPRRGSRGILDIPPRRLCFTKIT